MRGLLSDHFYMITIVFRTKIFTSLFTANKSTKTNLRLYLYFNIVYFFIVHNLYFLSSKSFTCFNFKQATIK